jgi:LPS sulfotransferase NodH
MSHKPTFRELISDASKCPRRYLAGLAAPWLGTPIRFVVLCTARTGSELLVSLLDSHPQVKCDSQILADEVLFPRRFIEGRAVRARYEGARAYGFKLHVNEITDVQRLGDAEKYLRSLLRRGDKIYRLRRRNLLKQVLSFARATQSIYHLTVGAAHPRAGPLELDPADVLAGLIVTERLERLADHVLAGLTHTTLVYEDDLADLPSQQRTLDRMFEEMGVSRFEVHPAIVPTSPARIRDAVSNYDAVAAVIGQTRFAKFLE